jgi:16S rRNA C967 or C1407 C5-methylase (RsmB/RsmF family)
MAMDFFSHYEALFGARWPALREALAAPGTHETLQFAGAAGPCEPYYLDGASVLAARALAVRPGARVLDMCAAPGGKSLVLASCLAGAGSLLCNELSAERRARLRRVLDASLPGEWRGAVSVSGRDGCVFGRSDPASFDFVLLDAPCSSERHVLGSPRHLAEWTPARSKNLARRQVALLASAADALAPGGALLYSTCALSPLENDGVARAILKKRPFLRALPVEPPCPGADATEYGTHILPDACGGMGPIYFAIFARNPSL